MHVSPFGREGGGEKIPGREEAVGENISGASTNTASEGR